jgi:hypothetical protein
MERTMRPCLVCEEPCNDSRMCRNCYTPAPHGSVRAPDADHKLFWGMLIAVTAVVALVLALGAVASMILAGLTFMVQP